jgi:hypothetical protein
MPHAAPIPTPGGGSGCTPGPGPLPDGVWFGYIDEITEAAVDFDLACLVTCEDGVGFTIRNDNPAKRTVDVADGAVVVFEGVDGDHSDDEGRPRRVESYADYWEYLVPFILSEGAPARFAVWIYVNAGAVTQIVHPAMARGCRSSAVDVEWMIELPEAYGVAFNEFGLLATASDGSGNHRFYWNAGDWGSHDELRGAPVAWWGEFTVAGSGAAVGFGDTIFRWSGTAWTSEAFAHLGEDVHVLGMSGDRVLMAATSGNEVLAYVLTRSGDAWTSDAIVLGSTDMWQTWSGAISGATFAVADTGWGYGGPVDGRGTVKVYDFDGTTWVHTATIEDPWPSRVRGSRYDAPGWAGNWGSSLDMDGDLLVVGDDGGTPGGGTPGAVYAYLRTPGGWEAELVAEGGSSFGFGARLDGDTIVAGSSDGDTESTFWVFTIADHGWLGTPIPIPADTINDSVFGLDVDGDLVAISTPSGLWIGRIVPAG